MGTSPLPAFSYQWVGGDIAGLEALNSQCRSVASTINGADRALTQEVSSVVGDAGWTGAAASAFSSAWDRDATAGGQLAQAWEEIGQIAATLAYNLAALESALEEAAIQVEQQGLPVDTSTGLPMPGTIAGGAACPSPQVAAAQEQLAGQYMAYRAGILQEAAGARNQALSSLYAVTTQLLPNPFDYGQLTNDLDGIRSLWAIPTTYRMEVEGQLQESGEAVDDMWQALIAGRRVSGNNFRLPKDLVEKGAKARAVLPGLESQARDAPPESLLNRLAGGDTDALGGLGVAAGAVRAVPYIGATVGGVLQVIQDRENHEPWKQSLADGAISNLASVGSATAATDLGAMLFGTGSVAVVGGTALAAGVIAVGVGDVVHNFIQDAPADWNKYGFLDGSGHAVVSSLGQTRHDIAHYADDILHFL